MNKKVSIFIIILGFLLLINPFQVMAQSIPAFPGAEGFGANTVGGRGGRVIEVTNLNDSGTGSLRACIEASGPRICVFKVSGTITVDTTLRLSDPYITIAGQTAPGGGITVRNNPSASLYSTINIDTHDVIIRYLRFRAGPTWGAGDAANIVGDGDGGVYNIIIDHCSFSWGVDDNYASWYDAHDYTIQWSIFSEGLCYSTHGENICHSCGVILGSYASSDRKNEPGSYNISFHHNLMAINNMRNPLIKGARIADVVNNVSYGPNGTYSHVDMDQQLAKTQVNFVKNYFKPASYTDIKPPIKAINDSPLGAEIYVEGNIDSRYRTSDSQPDINSVNSSSQQYVINTRLSAPAINTTTALVAYDQVLGQAGASLYKDAVDKRIIELVKRGQGFFIDAPGQTSCIGRCRGFGYYLTPEDYTNLNINDPLDNDGWPVLPAGTAYSDSDSDGMADDWENQYGFNADNSSDGPLDADGDGYTNLEEFLNGTNPKDNSPSPTPQPCPADLNGDNQVNQEDLKQVLSFWGQNNSGAEDLYQDDKINVLDLAIVIKNWGLCN